MDMIFRKMELDDIAQIVAIEEASFSTPWTADAFHRELTMNEHAHYIVLETATDNVRAQKLYEKLGMKIDDGVFHYIKYW